MFISVCAHKSAYIWVCVCIYKYLSSFMVPTDACFHVHWSHEAIITQTAILSRNVGTLAPITNIRIVFTFINIWRYKINIKWKEGWLWVSSDIFSPSSSTQIIWSQMCKIKLIRCTKCVYFLFCTCAWSPIRHQSITLAAAAFVASFWIGALGVAASVHYHALINICENIAPHCLSGLLP